MITAQDAFNIITEFKNYSDTATAFIQAMNEEIVSLIEKAKTHKEQVFEYSKLAVLKKKDLEDIISYYDLLGYDVVVKGSGSNLYGDRVDVRFTVKWDKNESTDENA